MIVKQGDTPDVAGANLERTQQSREVSNAATPEVPASSAAPKAATPVNDQIALSLATNLVQQASTAGQQASFRGHPTAENGDREGTVSLRSAGGRSCADRGRPIRRVSQVS